MPCPVRRPGPTGAAAGSLRIRQPTGADGGVAGRAVVGGEIAGQVRAGGAGGGTAGSGGRGRRHGGLDRNGRGRNRRGRNRRGRNRRGRLYDDLRPPGHRRDRLDQDVPRRGNLRCAFRRCTSRRCTFQRCAFRRCAFRRCAFRVSSPQVRGQRQRQHGAHRIRRAPAHDDGAAQHAAQLLVERHRGGRRTGRHAVQHPAGPVDTDEDRGGRAGGGVQLASPFTGERAHPGTALAQRPLDLLGQFRPEPRRLRGGQRAHREPAVRQRHVHRVGAPAARRLDRRRPAGGYRHTQRAEVERAGRRLDLAVGGVRVVRPGGLAAVRSSSATRPPTIGARSPDPAHGSPAPAHRPSRPDRCAGALGHLRGVQPGVPSGGAVPAGAAVRRRQLRRPRRTAPARPAAPPAARSGHPGAAAARRADRC